jgi:hypothetical protein
MANLPSPAGTQKKTGYVNADFHASASIATSKLATGALPSAITLAEANLSSELYGNYADVSLTAAQVKALHTTPYTLVAAPAAGYANVFDGALLFLDYSGGAFTSGNALVKYTNEAGQLVATVASSGFLTATSDQLRYVYPASTAAIVPVSAAALVLNVASTDPSGAAATSVLYVRTFFHVIPMTY